MTYSIVLNFLLHIHLVVEIYSVLASVAGLVWAKFVVGLGAKVSEEGPGFLAILVYHKVVNKRVFGWKQKG